MVASRYTPAPLELCLLSLVVVAGVQLLTSTLGVGLATVGKAMLGLGLAVVNTYGLGATLGWWSFFGYEVR